MAHRFQPYPHSNHVSYSGPSENTRFLRMCIKHVFDDGPAPRHTATPRFTIADWDPDAATLNELQAQLATSNRLGQTQTYSLAKDTWVDYHYPFKKDLLGEKEYLRPSTLRNKPRELMPLCPHGANNRRQLADCYMTLHTHQHPERGRLWYFQATGHQCSFLMPCPDNPASSLALPAPSVDTKLTVDSQSDMHTMQVTHQQHLRRRPQIKPEDDVKPSVKREPSSSSPWASSSASSSALSSSASSFSRPRPRPLAHPRPPRQVSRFSDEQANRNLHPHPDFITKVDHAIESGVAKVDARKHFLFDERAPDYPAEFLPFADQNSVSKVGAILDATESSTHIGKFLSSLSSTYGAATTSYRNLLSTLAVCTCCGSFFTIAGYHLHLEFSASGNEYVCSNHPNRDPVSPLSRVAVGDFVSTLKPRTKARTPFLTFEFNPLGMAWMALNSPFGLPETILEAVKSAMVTCDTCTFTRTLHAHEAHLGDSRECTDVAEDDLSVIITSRSKGKALQSDGTFRPMIRAADGSFHEVMVVDDSDSETEVGMADDDQFPSSVALPAKKTPAP
ncbi:hypothetical protein DFH09DRAFT_1067149 [Mycena vulgaris]|nr:hypothetical protein DFH09DRAFT_1067149 [Mycena vulgaris]